MSDKLSKNWFLYFNITAIICYVAVLYFYRESFIVISAVYIGLNAIALLFFRKTSKNEPGSNEQIAPLLQEKPTQSPAKPITEQEVWGFLQNRLSERSSQTATQEKMWNLLQHSLNEANNHAIGNSKVKMANGIISELKKGIYQLSEDELETYTCEVLKAVTKDSTAKNKYYATHILNGPKYLKTWGKDCSYYNSMKEFVEPQRTILNNGGEVVRIFIIPRPFLKKQVDVCKNMFDFHDRYYEDTRNKVTTLVYVPKNDKQLSPDITIVNDSIVFEWHRSTHAKYGYTKGYCYTSDEKDSHLQRFKSLMLQAHDLSDSNFDLSKLLSL